LRGEIGHENRLFGRDQGPRRRRQLPLDRASRPLLFGALVEAEIFGVNDERAPMWKARRDEIFDEIDKVNNKTHGGDLGATRVMGTVMGNNAVRV
jgi:hypothetical protein